jgi:hypothetical protein
MNNKYIFFLLFLPFFGCLKEDKNKKQRIEEMISENVDQRIQEYISIRNSTCREDVLVEAVRRADSVLLEEARTARLQNINIDIPSKPNSPSFALPKDFNQLKNKLDSIKPSNNN